MWSTTHRLLALALFIAPLGCGEDDDRATALSADAAVATDAATAATVSCGTGTCDTDEVCVHPVVVGGGNPDAMPGGGCVEAAPFCYRPAAGAGSQCKRAADENPCPIFRGSCATQGLSGPEHLTCMCF